ncbi:MAG: hypothetical protein U0T73_04595 [Chitinophagales bacterium]
MKHIIMLCLLCYSSLGFAQKHHIKPFPYPKTDLSSRANPKHLIASSDYNFDGSAYQIADTILYGYGTGNRMYDTVTTFDLTGGSMVPMARNVYRFSSGLQVIFQAEQEWTGSAWRTTYDETSDYNDTLKTFSLSRTWNGAINGLQNLRQEVYRYNASNQLTSSTFSSWDSASAMWQIYELDSQEFTGGKLSLKRSWIGNSHGGIQNKFRATYAYPASHVTVLWEDWDSVHGNWFNVDRFDDQYTGSDLTHSLVEYYDTAASVWKNNTQTDFQYTSGKLTLKTGQTWNAGSSIWENYSKSSYQYSGNNLVQTTEELWNAGQWMKSGRYTNIYNLHNDVIAYISEDGNDQNNSWFFTYMDTLFFDADFNLTADIPRRFDTVSHLWKPDLYANAAYYYYKEYDPNGISNIPTSGMTLFPIPTANQLHLSYESPSSGVVQLAIADAQGAVVYSQEFYETPGQNQMTLWFEDLAAGYYTVQLIRKGEKTYCGRWLKR